MKLYVKTAEQPMFPWTRDTHMDGVSVSEADAANGSPKQGDMIAQNPKDFRDMWLVAEKFFLENYIEKAGKQDPAVPHPRPFEFPPNSPRLRRDDRMTTPSFPGDIKRNQRPTTDAPIHHPPYTVTWCGTGVPRNPMTGCKDD
jgi:hypothetical protein